MRYSSTALVLATLASTISGHGVVTSITGANGVTMPGLSVADGTPRDCAQNSCGSQADTAIIRKGGPPLGKTQGSGPVDAAAAISMFMNGAGGAATAKTATAAKGTAKTAKAAKNAKRGLLDTIGANLGGDSPLKGIMGGADNNHATKKRALLDGLLGGAGGAKAKGAKAKGAGGAAAGGILGGLLGGGAAGGGGTKTPAGTTEAGVAAAAGSGADSGLPTVGADGTINMMFHQINQDGAGPLTAQIDPSSGGTDASAFQTAEMVQDVPGLGFAGLSAATNTDFPISVKMPAGMQCTGKVGGAENVCIVQVKNNTPAGPFGGSAAFTQDAAAQKRAIEYNRLKTKRFAASI